MTEAVVSGKDARCLFINNGDDLLTLKKVVSKKSDKDDGEKQKNKTSKELNGAELNGNHNKTDSINFDVDNTSSLEPNLEMDSDTDRNITLDSICTQEDRESENIDVSNENSNEADVKIGEKDKLISMNKSSDMDIPYSPNDSLDDNEYSHDLEDDDLELNNVLSPVSFFNISSRAPLHSNNELELSVDDDDDVLFRLRKDEEDTYQERNNIIEKKRKCEDSEIPEQKSNKVLKLWNIMKYPFQNITFGTSVNENETNISEAEVVEEDENSKVPETAVCENNSDHLEEAEEIIESNNTETETENVVTSENTVNKQNFCSVM